MNIDNYMSPTEAAHRWGISKRTLENRFRASEAHLLEPHFAAGRIKRFRAPDAKQYTWIVTAELMTLWYGAEPTAK